MKCKAVALHPRISGDELRTRIKRLGMTYTEAAERLGLTLDGLNKQMRGVNPVGRQTELLLDYLEKYPPTRRVRVRERQTGLFDPAEQYRRGEQARPIADPAQTKAPPRERDLAQHLYPTSRRTKS